VTQFLARFSRSLVAVSVHKPVTVVIGAVLISLFSFVFVSQHFSVRTDLDALISRDLPWRQAETRLEQAFPSQGEDLAALVEAPTPEQAEASADALTTTLRKRQDLFVAVRRQDGGDYFGRQALLFEDRQTVQQATARLIAAQPFIGPLVADPSLRGTANAVSTAVEGSAGDAQKNQELAPILNETARVAENDLAGKPVALSWLQLVTGQPVKREDLRRIVQLTPRLDQRAVNPGARPVAAVWDAWNTIKSQHAGSTMRLTGSVAMESDELKTLGEMTGIIAMASLAAMSLILFLAVRSVRFVGIIIGTVAVGLVITTAVGLALFGRFTLISVAFLPLFAGLGIDFTLQFAIRARYEQGDAELTKATLASTGFKAGPGILLATASVAAGFFAFWPTPYRGVSELGLIAGIGMGIAALATLTLLPAAFAMAARRIAPRTFNLRAFSRGPDSPANSAWSISLLTVVAAACAISVLSLPRLRFDFDPLSLRNPHSESVSAFKDLAANLDTTPNALEILAPSEKAARSLQDGVRLKPEVGRVLTAQDLVPPDQAAKLALIADARSIMEFSLDPFDTPPPPTDAETVATLRRAAASLTAAAQQPGPATASESRLAAQFDRLVTGTPGERATVERGLTQGITAAVARLRLVLDPMEVTLDTLPSDVRGDWVSQKGQWRVEAYPRTTSSDPSALKPFVRAVSSLAPTATGTPVTVMEAGDTVLRAFVEAALLSAAVIAVLVGGVLRSWRGAVLTILPILVTLTLTLGSCALMGLAINLENLIALPLLLGLAASFNIYVIVAWRDSASKTVRQNLGRAIFYSGLTTATAFAALMLSAHPGTASLGALLTISLFWTLVTALLILPALLSRFRASAP
jgi:hopanoid biosynthesis associated RND transporter like protein HpnN